MITRRDAFRLGGGTTLAVLMGAATFNVSCQPHPVPAAEPDPLLDLIGSYRAGLKAYEVQCIGNLSNEECSRIADATYYPHYVRLNENPPVPTTERGALEAVRLIMEEERDCGHSEGMTINVLTAALAFFDGRA